MIIDSHRSTAQKIHQQKVEAALADLGHIQNYLTSRRKCAGVSFSDVGVVGYIADQLAEIKRFVDDVSAPRPADEVQV